MIQNKLNVSLVWQLCATAPSEMLSFWWWGGSGKIHYMNSPGMSLEWHIEKVCGDASSPVMLIRINILMLMNCLTALLMLSLWHVLSRIKNSPGNIIINGILKLFISINVNITTDQHTVVKFIMSQAIYFICCCEFICFCQYGLAVM